MYCCPECRKFFKYEEKDKTYGCTSCKGGLVPLRITDSVWNSMSNEEKRDHNLMAIKYAKLPENETKPSDIRNVEQTAERKEASKYLPPEYKDNSIHVVSEGGFNSNTVLTAKSVNNDEGKEQTAEEYLETLRKQAKKTTLILAALAAMIFIPLIFIAIKDAINTNKNESKTTEYVSQDYDNHKNTESTVKTTGTYGGSYLSDDDKVLYWTIAEKEVKSRLKSPSSAKFPWSYNSEGVHITKNGDLVSVTGYVDADNGFGASVRTVFVVEIKTNGTQSGVQSVTFL